MPDFRVVDPAAPGARWALGEYVAEIEAAFGFERGSALEDALTDFAAPRGRFVVAGPDEAPIACCGVLFLDDERAEIKRMWVAPAARGRGLAGRLLEFVEGQIVAAGRRVALLDTNSTLTTAVGLYESHGYVRVPDYNQNPAADVWFSKPLGV